MEISERINIWVKRPDTYIKGRITRTQSSHDTMMSELEREMINHVTEEIGIKNAVWAKEFTNYIALSDGGDYMMIVSKDTSKMTEWAKEIVILPSGHVIVRNLKMALNKEVVYTKNLKEKSTECLIARVDARGVFCKYKKDGNFMHHPFPGEKLRKMIERKKRKDELIEMLEIKKSEVETVDAKIKQVNQVKIKRRAKRIEKKKKNPKISLRVKKVV